MHSPTTDKNALLIEAVESNNVPEVRRLLAGGAHPKARKRVTLHARVKTNGRTEWKSDAVDCETAIAIAVIRGYKDVVEALVESPAAGLLWEGPVSWRLSNSFGERDWTASEWNKERWQSTCSFPCVLSLAVGRKGTDTNCYSSTDDLPDVDGDLHINKRGGFVELRHPKALQDREETIQLEPRLDIVELLLAHGAPVTDAALSAARENPDSSFLAALVKHQRTPRQVASLNHSHPQSPTLTSSPTRTFFEPAALLSHQARKIDDLTAHVRLAEERATAAESRLAELTRLCADLRSQSDELRLLNSGLNTTVRSLEALVRSLETPRAVPEAAARDAHAHTRATSTSSVTIVRDVLGPPPSSIAPFPSAPPKSSVSRSLPHPLVGAVEG
ncbi:hypothetical protein M427DRAFT_404871 [Gonapodya prolifera JEL478]|uniref:Ankyrin n=1 Tax=Gonapodya prolifera (strain JEL478) TaxID=1344416 RepID=A0A139AU40_GONPJ|nr:hypothetical protein M427DRAFT_404871 [Gonapodya prolifera JEL478]|eukprot:KXS20219.1 hypothetical protein M427DRAFT_404871 [Gonapodya prolifera JEL478]